MRPIFIRFDDMMIDIAKVCYIETLENRLHIKFLQHEDLTIEYHDETTCKEAYNYLVDLFDEKGLH